MRQIDDFAHALIVRVPEFVHAGYSYSFCPRLFANVVVKSLCAALYVYLKQYTIRHESYRVLEQAGCVCVFSKVHGNGLTKVNDSACVAGSI